MSGVSKERSQEIFDVMGVLQDILMRTLHDYPGDERYPVYTSIEHLDEIRKAIGQYHSELEGCSSTEIKSTEKTMRDIAKYEPDFNSNDVDDAGIF